MTNSNDGLQGVIDRTCAQLVGTVKEVGVSLAFARSDISDLETVLLAVRDRGNESEITTASFMVGAYIGEILRRAIGGQWAMSISGVVSLQFPSGGGKIFPVEKVRKFIQNPDGESLAVYAQALLARH